VEGVRHHSHGRASVCARAHVWGARGRRHGAQHAMVAQVLDAVRVSSNGLWRMKRAAQGAKKGGGAEVQPLNPRTRSPKSRTYHQTVQPLHPTEGGYPRSFAMFHTRDQQHSHGIQCWQDKTGAREGGWKNLELCWFVRARGVGCRQRKEETYESHFWSN
jgi:hypothetical protein